MGKQGGFLEYERHTPGYRPADERLHDYRAVEKTLAPDELNRQAARCMNCGIPFCHGSGCPLGNVIPEFNDAAYKGEWERALQILLSTSSFPEFTARICPAPCEASCTLELSNGQPVAIRQIEYAVIEHGFEHGLVKPRPPKERSGYRVAVIGAGPAGLTVADVLNRHGHDVTVFDQWPKPGGILRYGIPDFKLEKWVVDRRVDLMTQEGVDFECAVSVGEDISYRYIRDRYDAIVLTGGSRDPRDLNVPGHDLNGTHFAMDFLTLQNRKNDGETIPADQDISAEGKNVIVVGGGDTGSDCIGTSLRQGAASVTQIEIMPEPPEERADHTPWPEWPLKLRTSSSHEEGCERLWSCSVQELKGNDGTVDTAVCQRMDCTFENGRPAFTPVADSAFTLPAQLVLLAMGFVGPGRNRIVEDLGIQKDPRGNIHVEDRHMTSIEGIFTAGDMSTGQSLVVRAMADGKQCAEDVNTYLTHPATHP